MGRRMGWYGPVGRNVYTARQGAFICGVKNVMCLTEAGDPSGRSSHGLPANLGLHQRVPKPRPRLSRWKRSFQKSCKTFFPISISISDLPVRRSRPHLRWKRRKSAQPLSPPASGSRLQVGHDEAVKRRARRGVKHLPTVGVHQPPPYRHARPFLAGAGAGAAGSRLASMDAKSSCRAAADVRLRPRRPSQRAAAAPRPIR